MLKNLKLDKKFITLLFGLTIPIILQNLIAASLNLLDNIMVGTLGEKVISAAGFANQFYMVFFYSVCGISMGAAIFMSQLWGKKDIEKIHEILDFSLLISIPVSILFALVAFIFPEHIINIFSVDEEVTKLGAGYLRIVSISYVISAITLSYSTALRSTGQTVIPMLGSIIGIFVNFSLNYLLILGHFGFPKLGLNGAAIGTSISRIIELLFLLFMIYIRKNQIATNFKSLKEISIEKSKRFFKVASPVIFNDIMWILGISTYSIAYAKLGVDASATMQIAITINNMFNIFGIGIGVASSIIIGNKIGEGKLKNAYYSSIKISYVGVIIGIIIGIIFYLLIPVIMKFFDVKPLTKAHTITVLKIMVIFLPIRFYAIIQVIGTLRGGGDVLYAIITEMIGIWCIGIPIAFISIKFIPNLSITTLYFLVCFEEVVKCFITFPRVMSRHWIKRVI